MFIKIRTLGVVKLLDTRLNVPTKMLVKLIPV